MTDTHGSTFFRFSAPDAEGWQTWDPPAGFNSNFGRMRLHRDGDDAARITIAGGAHLSNSMGAMHGAAILGLIDIAGGLCFQLCRAGPDGRVVTIDLATQFIAAGGDDGIVEVAVDVVRETGRIVFLRGLVSQRAQVIASFTMTMRKVRVPA